ncbi:hypothetical protein diail_7206 [Diaporthe ilicicola]|nr:hypothetical protein diail_7206 [Diaporthe ilicicola]
MGLQETDPFDTRHNGQARSSSEAVPETLRRKAQDPIAVIGMACRLPGNSNSPHALWEFLESGGVADNTPPATRFRIDTHHDGSTKPNTMRSPGGMFLENIDPKKFDAAFFQVGKVDAIAMDPQQRQLLEVVYECLENAGLPLEKLDGEAVGCFVGSYAVDYADMQSRDPDDRAPSVTIGVGRAILSNRISHFLNIHGPSMTIDTACSGSLVGLDVACRYLNTREINGALVAGANMYLSPEHVMDSGPMKGAASLSGRCHTFDEKADGYIKAEAVNCVMLKRLSDAVRDGDPIRAIVRGTATNSDGRTPGIASPSSEAQAMATKAAYANAGITDLSATGYIEMHGTGTQAGDPQEVKGVASVFAKSKAQDAPLIIGSIKSNVGHSEPAAGVSGLIKAVLAVEKGRIPGNPTFIVPNPNIDFEGSRVRATRYTIPWPAAAVGFRRASVNSFGYGGSNAHVIVDQVPEDQKTFISSFRDGVDGFLDDDETDEVVEAPHVLLFSANDEASLKAYTESLRKHLLNPKVKVSLGDLAYTLSERRSRHFHRGFLLTQSLSLDPMSIVYGKRRTNAPKIGFIFTGQGAQWSQMGRSLVINFPKAREAIQRLDRVLQKLIHPPSWSLMQELTEARSPERLREPEFSQPLVTALQIAIVEVLKSWGVHPEAVVGHSSGEIAAAYAAGLLSEEHAITAAYYRGYSVKAVSESSPGGSASKMGMMAAGLGADEVRPYIDNICTGKVSSVSIACFNSPQSVTLAGPVVDLEAVRAAIVSDGHFARNLQVDVAYHSPSMADAGAKYVKCLEEESFSNIKDQGLTTRMFSSVEGQYARDRSVDIQYWKKNMLQPVLFDQALKSMLTDNDSPDFLIEIGPSGALAGPTGQIKKQLPGGGSDILYCATMARGKEAGKAIFDVAGRLFIAGHNLDFRVVNNLAAKPEAPRLVTDLPNYAWNHNTDYWYENEASKDWRHRLYPHHDLLGSKVLGTPWQTPIWKKTLRLAELPWLKDHKLGPEVVFPGAGYMCMAVEAMLQTDAVLRTQAGTDLKHKQQVRLRNVSFDKALVLEEGVDTRVMLTLSPLLGQRDSWYHWTVRSLVEGSWVDHCKGQIRMEKDVESSASPSELAPLQHAAPGALWYKSMMDAGYNFGKSFQKLQLAETTSGSRSCRSQIDLLPPPSAHIQSEYPVHPAAFDGCMQSCAPGLWKGIRSSVNAVLVPAIIDDIVIRTAVQGSTSHGIAVSESLFAGPGRRDQNKNYASNTSVYSPDTGELLFQLKGLRYHMLDFQDSPYNAHMYSRLTWAPDATLSPEAFSTNKLEDWDQLQDALDLLSHKMSNARVVEVSLVPGESSSLWLEGLSSGSKTRNAFDSHVFFASEATAVVSAQAKYEGVQRTSFQLLDINQPQSLVTQHPDLVERADIVILRLQYPLRMSDVTTLMHDFTNILGPDSHILLLEQSRPWEPADHALNGSAASTKFQNGVTGLPVPPGFQIVHSMSVSESSFLVHGFIIAPSKPTLSAPESAPAALPLDIVHFQDHQELCCKVSRDLAKFGWDIRELDYSEESLRCVRPDGTILVLAEIEGPILPSLSSDQWASVQRLLQMRNRILWVSNSAQWQVNNPDGAMIHGLCRSVRTEDPSMRITTLDLEDAKSDRSSRSIDVVLRSIQKPPTESSECEYVEREGILHVSRILGDDQVNRAELAKTAGNPPVETRLHQAETTIRLVSERVGSIDSLQYVEISSEPLEIEDNKVEVELFASALNFKDVAVSMGIVPENAHLLGLEGAGTIRRIGSNLKSPFHVGQRVLAFEKGTFANRIIATTERTIAIPDWLSFEEAATLPSVYLTSLYSLFNLSNIKKGDKVLIHSATGGLGIASIQICHAIGAEVFATVGQDAKKQFLMEEFGIPENNIFNSRTTEFEAQLMKRTDGYGVDIILNSLTGDLLDASWRCIAEGGTMVELGKKDHIDRNTLAMEPFARNASYRCFDMSHKHVTDAVIATLMRQMMDMINLRVVKPISPIKLFAYDDIPSALRFMRGANHIGKIIISNKEHSDPDPPVLVRPSSRQFQLRGDVSYLIVGGLKGLCGSLAVDMARHGARNVVIIGRSGYDDPRSQAILKDLAAEGCSADLVRGDVSRYDDVIRAFRSASLPVGGVVQGAMVLRDRPFETMTFDDYQTATSPKVAGTWNLHNAALEMGLSLDFFVMLSSISGLIGQPAQSNYAAANVFLDSFAYYRRGLGLKANSVDLGAIDDIGYMAEHSELITALNTSAWTPINESLFHKIVQVSIQQQQDEPINPDSAAQLITSIAVPQSPQSRLLSDARFTSLRFGGGAGTASGGADGANREVEALILMVKNSTDAALVQPAAVDVVNKQFMSTLRLDEPLEPAKPLSAYGLDSLAAVEFRNWSRAKLGADLTTLEVTSAPSLLALVDKIVTKMQRANGEGKAS